MDKSKERKLSGVHFTRENRISQEKKTSTYMNYPEKVSAVKTNLLNTVLLTEKFLQLDCLRLDSFQLNYYYYGNQEIISRRELRKMAEGFPYFEIQQIQELII